MAQVAFDRVSKIYPDGTRAVNEMNLSIDDGEFMVLVGPSGCGKTTALRMVAGLEEISEGRLSIGDRVVNHVPSRDRDIAMVFQSYALYPHLSVYDNIAFGLRLKKISEAGDRWRVKRAAPLLGLEEFLKRKPRALSGGQRQRVAMGRAIVREPAAFLMDEPLSNLDAKLRVQMRAEIARLQSDLGVTTVYVTHDQVEAMTMGDRVAVMRKGELQQVDDPQTLYDRPGEHLRRRLHRHPGDEHARGDDRVRERRRSRRGRRADDSRSRQRSSRAARPAGYAGKPVILGDPAGAPRGRGAGDRRARRPAAGRTVELREALGSEIMVHFAIEAHEAETEEMREIARGRGRQRRRRSNRRRTERSLVVGRFNARSRVHDGRRGGRQPSIRARCTSSTRDRSRHLRREPIEKGATS